MTNSIKKGLASSLVLLACGFIPAMAQERTNKLSFGVRGGLNLSNIIKSDGSTVASEMKPGFNAAIFLVLPIANTFSVQPELQYSQKGYKSSGSFLGSPYSYTAETDYVEVPLLAKFSPSRSFAIVVGPQFSFLTSTKYTFKTSNTGYENVINNDNNNLRKNTLGGVAGIEAGAGKFIFSARYSLDFQTNNGDGTSSTPQYKNQVVGLSVGFKI